jgi:hypothetical protein
MNTIAFLYLYLEAIPKAANIVTQGKATNLCRGSFIAGIKIIIVNIIKGNKTRSRLIMPKRRDFISINVPMME